MKTEKIKIDSEYIKLQDLLKLGGAVETGGQAKVVMHNERQKNACRRHGCV